MNVKVFAKKLKEQDKIFEKNIIFTERKINYYPNRKNLNSNISYPNKPLKYSYFIIVLPQKELLQ